MGPSARPLPRRTHAARAGVAVLACAVLLAAGCERAGVVSPAEAVANLEAEGTFRFFADSAVSVQDEIVEFEVEGFVDLDRDAARYTSTLSPLFESQGVIVIGRDLYVPDGEEEPAGWQRSRRPDDEQPWVAERLLFYDGGGLLALTGLSEATAGEQWEDEQGRRCAVAESEDGTSDVRYCVDEQGRLRSVVVVAGEGSSEVRYDRIGEQVDVTAPPPDRVTEFDDSMAEGDGP